jgi:hypothetical protein
MSDKSAHKSAPGRPFTGADDPRRGRGPKKGKGGRPPKAFKAFASDLAQDSELQDSLKAAALSGDVSAIKLVIQYAEGLPVRTIRLEGYGDVQRAFETMKQVIRSTLNADDAERLERAIEQSLRENRF